MKKEIKEAIDKDVREFLEFVEEYMPVSNIKAKKNPQIPALVIPEFTEEDWEYLKRTGDWRTLKANIDERISHQP